MATTTSESLSVQSIRKASSDCSRRGSVRNDLLALILDAAVILINTSSEDHLDRIPKELIKRFLPLLKELWDKICSSTLPNNCCRKKSFLCSTKYDLAVAIFRLSMNGTHYATWGYDEIRKNMFGPVESEFENFVLKYWEDSPVLFRRASKNSENDSTVFSSLIHSFNPKLTDSIHDSILHGLVSCPPIASDELDILSFLNEVNSVLGSPIMYGQDIRILKTQKPTSGSMQGHVNKEVHFFKGKMGSEFIDVDCVRKCKEAFGDGYTIALRGFEFRNDKVAAIAEGLADLFGQPSIGANIYLTPPRSQGLARHYDDHCVFVWQLFGHKQWGIFPPTTTFLPRLYEPLGNLPGLEGDACEGMQFRLQEGDILYIPRGYPHEAYTSIDESESQNEASTMFSLHLTLGIEVEPPFEWEGFAHVALHCWNEDEKQKQAHLHLTDYKSVMRRAMFVNLLHVAIRLIADLNPVFRKACMVAALPFTEGDRHAHALVLNQKATFSNIIDRIDAGCSFAEAFRSIEAVVQEKNGDSLQWMSWLQHLPQEGDETEEVDFNNLLGSFEYLVRLYSEHIEEAMIEFTKIKSAFCRHVVYENACGRFKMLLEKYRKTRKQYMKGMLSLHSTY